VWLGERAREVAGRLLICVLVPGQVTLLVPESLAAPSTASGPSRAVVFTLTRHRSCPVALSGHVCD